MLKASARLNDGARVSQTGKIEIKVLVIGTRHEYQRHQDTMPDREKVRAEFDKFLRAAIEEQKIDLVVEEAGDDTAVWKNLRQEDQLFGEHAKASGSDIRQRLSWLLWELDYPGSRINDSTMFPDLGGLCDFLNYVTV
jgi:hypothetical protein